MQQLRIAGVVRESIVDGPGIRFTVFVQGCPHRCPGCHNAQTHDPSGGYDCPVQRVLEQIDRDPMLQGVTFSGGEPFEQAAALAELGQKIKERGLNLMAYSGYTFEQLLQGGKGRREWLELLGECDYLVDGRFELGERDLNLHFRGSRNQRILDVPASLREGKAVVIDL